jgi:hypothetical protein
MSSTEQGDRNYFTLPSSCSSSPDISQPQPRRAHPRLGSLEDLRIFQGFLVVWSFPWLSCVSMVVQATKSTSPQSSPHHHHHMIHSIVTSYNESPHCSDHLKAFTRKYTCLDTLRHDVFKFEFEFHSFAPNLLSVRHHGYRRSSLAHHTNPPSRYPIMLCRRGLWCLRLFHRRPRSGQSAYRYLR